MVCSSCRLGIYLHFLAMFICSTQNRRCALFSVFNSSRYGNNCICRDHCTDDKCYAGDVKKTVEFGFDSIKLDGCGQQMDLSKWANYFNATGKSILIENCHWGDTLPTATECPYNYFRSSTDIRASYDVVMHNLMTVPPIAEKKLSRPGCWAYVFHRTSFHALFHPNSVHNHHDAFSTQQPSFILINVAALISMSSGRFLSGIRTCSRSGASTVRAAPAILA